MLFRIYNPKVATISIFNVLITVISIANAINKWFMITNPKQRGNDFLIYKFVPLISQ
jgi:hypothetical protein